MESRLETGRRGSREASEEAAAVVLEGDMTVTCTQCVAMEMEKRG